MNIVDPRLPTNEKHLAGQKRSAENELKGRDAKKPKIEEEMKKFFKIPVFDEDEDEDMEVHPTPSNDAIEVDPTPSNDEIEVDPTPSNDVIVPDTPPPSAEQSISLSDFSLFQAAEVRETVPKPKECKFEFEFTSDHIVNLFTMFKDIKHNIHFSVSKEQIELVGDFFWIKLGAPKKCNFEGKKDFCVSYESMKNVTIKKGLKMMNTGDSIRFISQLDELTIKDNVDLIMEEEVNTEIEINEDTYQITMENALRIFKLHKEEKSPTSVQFCFERQQGNQFTLKRHLNIQHCTKISECKYELMIAQEYKYISFNLSGANLQLLKKIDSLGLENKVNLLCRQISEGSHEACHVYIELMEGEKRICAFIFNLVPVS
jgi:hypothetical protein